MIAVLWWTLGYHERTCKIANHDLKTANVSSLTQKTLNQQAPPFGFDINLLVGCVRIVKTKWIPQPPA